MKNINFITVLLISILMFSAGCGNKAPEKEYLSLPTIKVDTTTALIVKDYIGTIEGKVNVEIRSQVEGSLQEIYVDEGQYVQSGQPLFRIDPSTYVEILNNEIANENIERAKLKNAKLEVQRIEPLIENKVIAEVQLQAQMANYEVAQASLARASAAVASAKINVDRTIIKAPVQGYIGMIPKRIGNLVTRDEKTPLTLLSDVSDVYVYFSMSESDYLYFTRNKSMRKDNVRNSLGDILPEAILYLADGMVYQTKGIVDAVSGQVNRSTGAISLRASFPNSSEIMRSGNTGTVQLKESRKGVILIPQESVLKIQDKNFVYIVDKDSRAHLNTIHIDGISGDDYIITDGLNIGDVVIITGFHKIEEGILIEPKEEE